MGSVLLFGCSGAFIKFSTITINHSQGKPKR